MNARELLKAGRLNDAIQALASEVRDNPADVQRRTFLFELLCFAGEYDRASKHLQILADSGPQSQMGALLYTGALHADRTRQEMFEKREFPNSTGAASSVPLTGTLNGKPFESITDGDPRIGARLEVIVAGSYMWLPYEHIVSVEIPAPKRLRDLLWSPAVVHTGRAFQGREMGEVLLPVLTPLAWKHPEDNVRLGRTTVWEEAEGIDEPVPVGQKMFLVDGEEVPLLELRKLEFAAPPPVQ